MLSEALRLIRVYHDLKQKELADRFAVSASYLSEIESGKKIPTLGFITKYSEEFNIPVSSILFFSENIKNPSGVDRVRNFVAKKIIDYLKLIEGSNHGRKQK